MKHGWRNWLGLGSFLILLVMGTFVFSIAQKMHTAQTQLDRLNHETAQERDNLRVLQAEWTYLNNPDRLEKLATTLFGLQPLDGKQYAALTALPTTADLEAIEIAKAEQLEGVKKPANDNTAQIAMADTETPTVTASAPMAPAIAMPAPIQASLTSVGGVE